MGEIATRMEPAPPAQGPAPISETAALLAVIERAARDPSVDIERMERLLAMQERVLARNAKAAFAGAFAQMQTELPVIDERGGIRDKQGSVQSTYARWEDLNDAIRPVLSRYGFGLSFRTGAADDGKIVVTGILAHVEGHQEETTLALPHDSSGSKNAVQAVGSSTSYGKRYTAMALLNITSRARTDHDDDGRAGGTPGPISDDQLAELRDLIEAVEADEVRFAKFMKVERLADLPASRFQAAVDRLKAFGEENKRGRR